MNLFSWGGLYLEKVIKSRLHKKIKQMKINRFTITKGVGKDPSLQKRKQEEFAG